MYIKLYKCKMCGEISEEEDVDKVRADSELLTIDTKRRHLCKNGDFGVAEFIGFRKN